MPRIRKKEFDRLQRAGNSMSNVCFNLKQETAIAPRYRESMKAAQEEWDAAKEAVRQSWIREEPPTNAS